MTDIATIKTGVTLHQHATAADFAGAVAGLEGAGELALAAQMKARRQSADQENSDSRIGKTAPA